MNIPELPALPSAILDSGAISHRLYEQRLAVHHERERILREHIAALEADAERYRDAAQSAAHDAISRALDEACIRDKTHRGMCLEIGMETFVDAIDAARSPE